MKVKVACMVCSSISSAACSPGVECLFWASVTDPACQRCPVAFQCTQTEWNPLVLITYVDWYDMWKDTVLLWTSSAVPAGNPDTVLLWTSSAVPAGNPDTFLQWTSSAVPAGNPDTFLQWTSSAVPAGNQALPLTCSYCGHRQLSQLVTKPSPWHVPTVDIVSCPSW